MNRRRLLLAAAVLLPATSVFALRHLKLVRSEPAANAKLSVSPAAIRLWFTQETQLAVTKVSLVRADGELMPLPALTHAPGKEEPVVAAVPSAITPGAWKIRWRTVAKDGHPIRGEIPFTLAPTATR
jgi:methionine-rich copper-binding protein CopC